MRILTKYVLNPLEKIVHSIRKNYNLIEGLALPDKRITGEQWRVEAVPRVFEVDDLAYFIGNAPAIARQIAQEGI